MFSSTPLFSCFAPQLLSPSAHGGAYVCKTLLSESYKAVDQQQCCLSFDWYDSGNRWNFNSLVKAWGTLWFEGWNAKEAANCINKGFDCCYMINLQFLGVVSRFCHLFVPDKNVTTVQGSKLPIDHYGYCIIRTVLIKNIWIIWASYLWAFYKHTRPVRSQSSHLSEFYDGLTFWIITKKKKWRLKLNMTQ